MIKNTKNQLIAILAALLPYCCTQAYAAGVDGPGLPQLDTATWPSQLFWLVVLFGTGYLVMAKLVTPRIGAVLEERRKKLDGDLEKARLASADAARIRAEYENNLEKARIDAAEHTKQAAANASKKLESADAKTAQKLTDKVTKAEAKLAKAKADAMTNLNMVAADAAVEAVFALAGITTTSAQAGKAAAAIAAKQKKQESN